MTTPNDDLLSELLCLADSKWTLGHWYIKVMLNCLTLTDATAFAGMSQDELGHTRALFRYLEEFAQLPDHQLEFGRTAQEVHSMQLLDAAPVNRGDFILTAHLAESALWHFLLTFKNGNNPELAGMVKHFGKESRFHRLNLLGWIKSANDEQKNQMIASLPNRLPLAIQWFSGGSDDPLVTGGIRTTLIKDAMASFIEGPIAELIAVLEVSYDNVTDTPENWDFRRRRIKDTGMPDTLWEFMLPTSDIAALARRPLSVSIDDNIDLFDKTG
jgi:1,2-phenylacetyl-CoA epoxidase catalytic subunit